MSDTWTEEPSSGLTIKYGKGYEAPWFTPRGTDAELRQQLITHFGLDADESESLTTAELVVNASTLANRLFNAASALGGTVIDSGQAGRPSGGWGRGAQAAAPAAPAEPERNPLYASVEGVTNVADLGPLYARNKAAFDGDAELLAAWKAKGKELSAK